jgi:hypothetical protein
LKKYAYFSETNVSRKAEGPNWERGALTEKLAKMPHLLYQESYKKKQELVFLNIYIDIYKIKYSKMNKY